MTDNPPGDLRPIPDPTVLTTAALTREVASLKELMFTRLDAMDKAVDLLGEIPTDTDKQIGHLKELFTSKLDVVDERFDSVQTQFIERDTRAEQTSRDSKVAVDAALQAAKEAVAEQNKSSALAIAKSETATTKQIDQLGVQISTATNQLKENIDDVKDRLTRIEGEGRGSEAAKTIQQTSNTSLVGVIGLILGALIGIGGLVAAFMK